MIRDFKQVLSENNLANIRFHDLRHTTATLLLSRGVNLKRIASILGHSQIGVTIEHYAHVLPKETDDDIDDFAADVFKRR